MTSKNSRVMKVVVIAGGVGGARMALGFSQLPSIDLSVVVNVGDDDCFHGLEVCPDLDTVLYTLSGVVHKAQGWGVENDATRALSTLRRLEAPDTWMTLGDADLGLHIYRTRELRAGRSLTDVMAHAAKKFGLEASLLPVTDGKSPTRIVGVDGPMRFQEWFVKSRGTLTVTGIVFESANRVEVTAQVRAALNDAELIVIAPSNPRLSIDPMLAIPGFRDLLVHAKAQRVAVSPLIAGKAVKGPLVQLLQDLGAPVSSEAIARHYAGLIDAFVIDETDDADFSDVSPSRDHVETLSMPTLMTDAGRSRELALRILRWASHRGGAS